jgi:hypothetical protein
MVPLHAIGEGMTTVGMIVLPHASTTAGGVGVTASAGQLTVDDPLAGNEKSGALTV